MELARRLYQAPSADKDNHIEDGARDYRRARPRTSGGSQSPGSCPASPRTEEPHSHQLPLPGPEHGPDDASPQRAGNRLRARPDAMVGPAEEGLRWHMKYGLRRFTEGSSDRDWRERGCIFCWAILYSWKDMLFGVPGIALTNYGRDHYYYTAIESNALLHIGRRTTSGYLSSEQTRTPPQLRHPLHTRTKYLSL